MYEIVITLNKRLMSLGVAFTSLANRPQATLVVPSRFFLCGSMSSSTNFSAIFFTNVK